jgi:hypothetical protein
MTTYLDVQHYPDVFQSGLRQILEKVSETRHWLMRLTKRSQLAQKLVVAVDELLISAKASLEVLVLASLSIPTSAERFNRLTWDKRTTPSFDRCISVSSASAPTSTAPRKAPMVFSGNFALYPRWAIACGLRFPETSFFAYANEAGVASAHMSLAIRRRMQLYLWGSRFLDLAAVAPLSCPTASSDLQTQAAHQQPYFR